MNCLATVLPFGVTVDTQKTNGVVYEGDSVTLKCSTENCTPQQEPFVWFKNGLLLPQVTEQEIRFSSVSHRDFGNYSCGLNNGDRTSTTETLLDVRCKYTFNHATPERATCTDLYDNSDWEIKGNFLISLYWHNLLRSRSNCNVPLQYRSCAFANDNVFSPQTVQKMCKQPSSHPER